MEVQGDVSRRRTCATYAGDMHALELHMLEAFERQIPLTKEIREAHVVVASMVATAKRHAQVLNDLVNSLGDVEKIVTDKLKSAVAGFFGIAAGLVDTVRPLAVSKALRDDYTAVNHAIVGYVMLSTTAAAVKNEETRRIANEFLNDWIGFAQQIMGIIPALALRDLSDSGIQALDFEAGRLFKEDKQWSSLFHRESVSASQSQSQSHSHSHSHSQSQSQVAIGVTESVSLVDASLTQTSIAQDLVAPNKIVVEKVTVHPATVGKIGAPVIEVINKPVIVEETFRPEKIIEVQPVIHRQIDAPEVHHIERHIYERVETTGPTLVTNKAIIEETIRPHIIEEVQEIIHRELPAPYVEKIEKHTTEVEVMPTLHTKEVILEKEEVLKADLVVENVEIDVIAIEGAPARGLSAGAPVSGLAEALKKM